MSQNLFFIYPECFEFYLPTDNYRLLGFPTNCIPFSRFHCRLSVLFSICSSVTRAVEVECEAKYFYTKACHVQIRNASDVTQADQIFIQFPDTRNISEINIILVDKSSNLNTRTLPTKLFEAFPNVRDISHTDGYLEIIPSRALSTINALYSVSLDRNKIHIIQDFAFAGLTNLKFISLSENRLRKINRHTFAAVPTLTYLFLNKNQIEEIAVDAFNLPSLEELYISHNNLKSIPDSTFSSVPKLKNLYLNNNNIRRINNSLYGLKKLTDLNLAFNPIEDLDIKKVTQLPNLARAFLEDSGFNLDFVDIPSDVATVQRSNVRLLDLSGNKMENGIIFEKLNIFFPNLGTLLLRYNRLVKMDLESVKSLPKLGTIFIEGNQFDRKWLGEITQNLSIRILDGEILQI